VDPGEDPVCAMTRTLRERVGLEVSGADALGSVQHVFTHLKLRLHVLRCGVPRGRVRLRGFDAFRWLAPEEVAELPHGAATRKALTMLERSSDTG
jgi:adenine-specific DNA glycosylase